MGAATMDTNRVAERNRELALRRKLEGLPREELVDRAVRLHALAERRGRDYVEVQDDLDEAAADLAIAGREVEVAESRIRLLERVFRHGHVAGEENLDKCDRCGLDIRDPVHERRTVKEEAPDVS